MDALQHLKPNTGPCRDRKSAGRHQALVEGRIEYVLDIGHLFVAILHAARQNQKLRLVLQAGISGEGSPSEIGQLIGRAVERGEIASSPAMFTYLPLIFLAPIVMQPLIATKSLDASLMIA